MTNPVYEIIVQGMLFGFIGLLVLCVIDILYRIHRNRITK